jgi:hypothetical protein
MELIPTGLGKVKNKRHENIQLTKYSHLNIINKLLKLNVSGFSQLSFYMAVVYTSSLVTN